MEDKTIAEMLESLGFDENEPDLAPSAGLERDDLKRARKHAGARRTRIVDDSSQLDQYREMNESRPCWVIPGQPLHLMDETRANAIRGTRAQWLAWCEAQGHSHTGLCPVCTPRRYWPDRFKVAIAKVLAFLASV